MIDRINIAPAKVPEHITVQLFSVNHFGLDTLKYLSSEYMHLFDKFRSQLLHWNVNQVLKGILIRQRSDHGHTVTIGEEALQEAPYSILLVD